MCQANTMRTRTEVYTYFLLGKEYNSLALAREAALAAYPGIHKWDAKFYDQCAEHGDSEIGLNANGAQLCEIKFLMNHRHCNARQVGEWCGYDDKIWFCTECREHIDCSNLTHLPQVCPCCGHETQE